MFNIDLHVDTFFVVFA